MSIPAGGTMGPKCSGEEETVSEEAEGEASAFGYGEDGGCEYAGDDVIVQRSDVCKGGESKSAWMAFQSGPVLPDGLDRLS
jgi:hypothetical protein